MKKSILISLLLIAMGVGLQAQTDIPSKQNAILGTWIWKRTECCNMGGGSHRKASPNGREKVIVMAKDSIFKLYENGELSYTGKYAVHGTQFMKDPIMYTFNTDKTHGILRFKGDTLVIGNCATDGCDEYFANEKQQKKKYHSKKTK